MTLKQLARMHKSYLAEFNRAAARRRRDLEKYFKYHMNQRKKLANPNNSTQPKAVKLKVKMMNMIHRSVMNSAANPRCARWMRAKKGGWYTTSKRRCMA